MTPCYDWKLSLLNVFHVSTESPTMNLVVLSVRKSCKTFVLVFTFNTSLHAQKCIASWCRKVLTCDGVATSIVVIVIPSIKI